MNEELSANPAKDAFLCVDGLVRAGGKPLELESTDIKPIIPKFGKWNVSCNTYEKYEDNGGTSSGATTTLIYEKEYFRTFSEIDPIFGLSQTLNEHALAINNSILKVKTN